MATWSLKMPTKSMIVSHHHPSGMPFKLHQSQLVTKWTQDSKSQHQLFQIMSSQSTPRSFDLAQNAMRARSTTRGHIFSSHIIDIVVPTNFYYEPFINLLHHPTLRSGPHFFRRDKLGLERKNEFNSNCNNLGGGKMKATKIWVNWVWWAW